MFERFTADARRTVELAGEVAEEIGHGLPGAGAARSLSVSRLQGLDRER